MKKIFIIFLLILMLSGNQVMGSDTNAVDKNKIIGETEEKLGISEILEEAQSYTSGTLDGIDIKSIYEDALTGTVNLDGTAQKLMDILGSETMKTIRSLGYILIIIIIHSIIKSISEGMGNEQIGEITYYVQYVLIVTLIMTSFSATILLIKDTVREPRRLYQLASTYTNCTNDINAETS